MKDLTPQQKRKVIKLWNALRPLQRHKVFRMTRTCMFVFHTWGELDNRQKEIVLNAVRIIVEEALVNHEVNIFISELKIQLAKSIARNYGGV